MAQNVHTWLNAPIINLDTTDSTNNDAMRLIDADKAHPGTTIVTRFQESGKGQRGNTWTAKLGESLMMSLITVPPFGIDQQFIFSALVATAIAKVIQAEDEDISVKIKWPNDIIINDKKAGGILIENVLRGHSWLYAVIGLGLNIMQQAFDPALPNATSLKIASGRFYSIQALMVKVRTAIIEQIAIETPPETIIRQYNELLFRKDEPQAFLKGDDEWTALIRQVLPNGQMEVQLADGSTASYTHGEVTWKYGSTN